MRYVGVPLAPGFSLDERAMTEAIQTHAPALIFIAYPNNPTGNLFDARAIARVLELAPGAVVIDEAYHAFAGRTYMDRLGACDNLLVMKTEEDKDKPEIPPSAGTTIEGEARKETTRT